MGQTQLRNFTPQFFILQIELLNVIFLNFAHMLLNLLSNNHKCDNIPILHCDIDNCMGKTIYTWVIIIQNNHHDTEKIIKCDKIPATCCLLKDILQVVDFIVNMT